jgi:hypothetical protein
VAEGLTMYNNDLLDAKKRALADAQKNAVEMTVGVYVNAATRVEKALMVDQQILAKTNGYIKKYKILSEGQDGNFYKTKIEALVKIEEINKDLSLLGLNTPPQPTTSSQRLAVFIQDKIDGVEDKDGVSENALADRLLSLQYKVVNNTELVQAAAKLKAGDLVNNPEQQNKVGEMVHADVLVVGSGASSFNTDQGLGGLISYRGNITFKVVKVKQSALIYSNSFSAGGASTTREAAGKEALKRAAAVAGEDLVQVLDQRLKSFNFITVTVKNVTTLNQLNALIKGLQGMIEVKNVQTDKFAEGTADIRVGSETENTAVIGKKLENMVKDVALKVTSIGTDTIEAQIQ